MKKNSVEIAPSKCKIFNLKYQSEKVFFELNKKTTIKDSKFEPIGYESLLKIGRAIKRLVLYILEFIKRSVL